MRPRAHYAKCGDLNIAYQVTGEVSLKDVPGTWEIFSARRD